MIELIEKHLKQYQQEEEQCWVKIVAYRKNGVRYDDLLLEQTRLVAQCEAMQKLLEEAKAQ